MNSKFWLFLSLVLSSCSTVGEYIDEKLISSGIAKTISNQHYKTLRGESNFFILGSFKILYEGNNITKSCTVSFNSTGGPGQVLGETGDVILPTKQKQNLLYALRCAKREINPFLEYFFSDFYIATNGEASYLGEVI